MNKLTSTLILLLCAGVASADDYYPSYNYAQLSYGTILSADDFLGYDVGGSDLGAGVSVEAGESFFVRGGYSKGTLDIDQIDDVDVTSYVVEIGFHNDLSSTTDFVATIGFIDSKVTYPVFRHDGVFYTLGSVSEDAALASIGFRGMLSKRLELHGDVTYVDFDNSQTILSVGAVYDLGESVALQLGLSRSEEATVAGLSARLYFGN